MNKLAEQHEALGHYIDALLTSGDLAADADGPRPAGAAAPIIESCGHDTGARDFMIVQVRDLKLAIDAARVQSVMPFPASGVACRDGLPVCLQPIGHTGSAVASSFPKGMPRAKTVRLIVTSWCCRDRPSRWPATRSAP